MNAIKRAFLTVSFLGLGFAAGCGEVSNVKCTTSAQCVKLAADPTQPLVTQVDGGSNPANPVCCGGFCLLPAVGCDSSMRYQTDDPGYGVCASTTLAAMCPTP